MATKDRSTLKGFFETGDVPNQQNYTDLIDSQLNLIDTSINPQIISTGISASFISSETHITASGNISSSGLLSIGTGSFDSHITASGNISASGNIIASQITGALNATEVTVGGNTTVTTLNASSHITASGNISSSGTVISNIGTFTTLTNINTTHVTASGNISASGELLVTGEITTGDDINVTGGNKFIKFAGQQGFQIGSTASETLSIVSGDDPADEFLGIDRSTSPAKINISNLSVLDIQNTTVATDASGDTGAIRTEGGISIAKNISLGTHITASGEISASSNILTSGNVTALGTISAEQLTSTDDINATDRDWET